MIEQEIDRLNGVALEICQTYSKMAEKLTPLCRKVPPQSVTCPRPIDADGPDSKVAHDIAAAVCCLSRINAGFEQLLRAVDVGNAKGDSQSPNQ